MYFFQFEAERTFSLFDITHIIVLLVTIAITAFIFIKRSKLVDIKNKDRFFLILGSILLFLDISFYFWKWVNGQQPMFPIPMHLCSWATYIVAITMITRNKTLFQVAFYYGITGGLLSLLVPEFGGYSFDHMRFYQFFGLHYLILILPILFMVAYRIKLQYKFIYITLGIMIVQAAITFPINLYVESIIGDFTNMMFVREAPTEVASIFPAPPFHLVVFAIIFILLWNGIYKLFTSKKWLQY